MFWYVFFHLRLPSKFFRRPALGFSMDKHGSNRLLLNRIVPGMG